MVRVAITPQVLRWARERLGMSPDDLAHKMGRLKVETVLAWEEGTLRPTYRQARKLARILRIPLGYLFLSEPPDDPLPVRDFRIRPNHPPRPPSPDLLAVLYDAMRKQDWYREYRQEEGLPHLPFVGRYDEDTPPQEIAEDMRRVLDLPENPAEGAYTWEDYLRNLVQHAESAGILVLRNGVVLNNPHRPLDVDEFRGFALADPYAPLIFINARDPVAAQIFTLAHELAHLWLGSSGISNPDLDTDDERHLQKVERLCNRIAAEFLVPADVFRQEWSIDRAVDENIEHLAKLFRVSQFVILYRARHLGLLDRETFHTLWEERSEVAIEVMKKTRPKGQRGDFYRTLRVRNSPQFTRTLLLALLDGRVVQRDAAMLLNVSPKTLRKLLEQQEGWGNASSLSA